MKSEQPTRLPPYLLLRWLLVVAIPAGLAALFVWCGGWLSDRPTAQNIISAFEATTVPHPGFRRNHAKGICVSGYFDSNGNGAALSRASVFAPGRYPVIGRLSMPGSSPAANDSAVPVRSFALSIALPHDEQWRVAMNSAPIFAVRTPQALLDMLKAQARDPQTGHAEPERMRAFLRNHPETRAFDAWLAAHPPSSGFDNAAYYGISAFRMTSAQNVTRFVRWDVEPDAHYEAVDAKRERDPNFLAHWLIKRLAQGPVRWHWMLSAAMTGDSIDDSTQQWAESPKRERIDAGVLVIERAQPQIDGPCRDIVFDPLMLPDGIAPSDDPLLAARESAYQVSFNRRVREEASF